MSERILFDALTDGEFCHDDCPRLRGTLEGVPKFIRRGYPKERNYVCQFFGPLSDPYKEGGFTIQRPRRAPACLEEGTPSVPASTRPMIYLAIPYSHDDAKIRKTRFELANKAAAQLMREKNHVFSPISQAHPIIPHGNLPVDWEYWKEYDRSILSICTELVVLLIDGWKTSTGVQAEIKIARELGLKITYMNPKTWERRSSPDG